MQTTNYERRKRACQKLKTRCPLPQLLDKLGLGRHARPSCRSPLRQDQNASWGVFERDGRHFWKDLGTGDGGDEITFIARFKGWDEQKDFKRILDFYERVSRWECRNELPPPASEVQSNSSLPNCAHLKPGSEDQIVRLAELRAFSVAALESATKQNFLVFGHHLGFEVFGVKDQSGWLVEVRRLDGMPFPQQGRLPERKSHTVRGSIKSWALGVVESESKPAIALVEGLPDFLACFDFVQREGKGSLVAPVAMLSASVFIDENSLEWFRGKHVRIYPHDDPAGFNAAELWTEQLTGVAASVEFFLFRKFAGTKDLADLNRLLVEAPRYALFNGEVLP